MLWYFRGTPHYLGQEAKRLGVTQVLADRRETTRRFTGSRYYLPGLRAVPQGPKRGRHRSSRRPSSPRSAGTLLQCEQECAKLHALASAAALMIDEAWEAFDGTTPARHFAVLGDFDKPSVPLRLGDGTVGVDNGVAVG